MSIYFQQQKGSASRNVLDDVDLMSIAVKLIGNAGFFHSGQRWHTSTHEHNHAAAKDLQPSIHVCADRGGDRRLPRHPRRHHMWVRVHCVARHLLWCCEYTNNYLGLMYAAVFWMHPL